MEADRGRGLPGNHRLHRSSLSLAQTRGQEMQVPQLLTSGGIGTPGSDRASANNLKSPAMLLQAAVDAEGGMPEGHPPSFVVGRGGPGGNPGYQEFQDAYGPRNHVQLPPALVNTPAYPRKIGEHIELAHDGSPVQYYSASGYPAQGTYAGDGNLVDDTMVSTPPSTTTTMYAKHGSDPGSSAEPGPHDSGLTESKKRRTLEYCHAAYQGHCPRFHDVNIDDSARLQGELQHASRLAGALNWGMDPYNDGNGLPAYPFAYPLDITEDPVGPPR